MSALAHTDDLEPPYPFTAEDTAAQDASLNPGGRVIGGVWVRDYMTGDEE
ncbi:hypothetical protein [Cellulomonas shaoxiangyii]|nr:hypothetical protein [Cellulomonas shaoxiangyii]